MTSLPSRWTRDRPGIFASLATPLLVLCLSVALTHVIPAAPALPERLTDPDFWKLVSDLSEPGGYFQNMDNFTSNEREIGQIVTMIRHGGPKGGVYVGVGPEQNLTYISAIRPAMAFVVDIRRQAVMQHLMFKAMFELSADRADFLSLLFAKPRPAGLERGTAIDQIWKAFAPVASDPDVWAKNYERILARLTKTHGFTLTEEETLQLKHVADAFYSYGPQISTRGGGGVTFAELTGAYEMAGRPQSFLSDDESFQLVKSLHERNLIVPLSGDFGGPEAIRAIGVYVREHGGTVSAFYVSNVEQYLFQDGKARAFYGNVATLPVADTSVFIRPYAFRRGTPEQSLCPITPFLRAAEAGRVTNHNDALACVSAN